MQIPPSVPLTALVAHPRVESLRDTHDALKLTFETAARVGLSPEQRTDLQKVEADVRRLAELKPLLHVDVSGTPDMFADTTEAKRDTDAVAQSVAGVLEKHRSFPSAMYFYGAPGDGLTTGLNWKTEKVSPALSQMGYSAASYTLSYDAEHQDFEAQAALQRADGSPDLHYLQYRVSVSGPGQEHWRGAELVLGNADGYKAFKATPLGKGSEDLYVSDDSQMHRWSAAEQAFVAQAMQDLGVGWLVPTLCPHCK